MLSGDWVFVSKQEFKIFKHAVKQSVEIWKFSEETKSTVKFLKSLAAFLSYSTWLSYVFFSHSSTVFFWSHFYFSYPVFVFMWVTARYLKHGKHQCKFEKGQYNVFKKLKHFLWKRIRVLPQFLPLPSR